MKRGRDMECFWNGETREFKSIEESTIFHSIPNQKRYHTHTIYPSSLSNNPPLKKQTPQIDRPKSFISYSNSSGSGLIFTPSYH